ncbi:hypothetical protein H8D85_02000 [bacterium]|nr:hypothetical protein [bacterium]
MPTAPSLPELETEEFLEIVELPEAHTLGVVDREAKGSVSVVPTEELLMNRTSSSTERSNKRFKLIEDPSIHT